MLSKKITMQYIYQHRIQTFYRFEEKKTFEKKSFYHYHLPYMPYITNGWQYIAL